MRVSGWAKTPALPTTDAYLPAKLQAAPPREGPARAPKNSSFSWLACHTRGRANCFPRGHAAVEDRLRPVLEQKRLLPLSRVQATMTPEACILLRTTIFSSTFQKGYNGTAAPAAVPTGSSRVPEYWSVRYLRNHPCGPSPDQSVTISRRIPSTSYKETIAKDTWWRPCQGTGPPFGRCVLAFQAPASMQACLPHVGRS